MHGDAGKPAGGRRPFVDSPEIEDAANAELENAGCILLVERAKVVGTIEAPRLDMGQGTEIGGAGQIGHGRAEVQSHTLSGSASAKKKPGRAGSQADGEMRAYLLLLLPVDFFSPPELFRLPLALLLPRARSL